MVRSDRFLLRCIADEFILMPILGEATQENKIIILNETAADICQILDTSHTLPQLVEQMCKIYDAPEPQVAQDVAQAVDRLLDLGVIHLEYDEKRPGHLEGMGK